LERRAAGTVNVFFVPALTWEHIDFNLDNPLLQDIRVRRAIAHGINRIQIVQQLFGGKQPISHTYLPAKHPGYTDAVQKYPYDPARSRTLLMGAAFALGPDGIMRNATGERLSLEFNTTAGNATRERVQQIIQQQLQQVGIEVTIANHSPRVIFGELNQRRKFRAMSMYSWIWGPESSCDGIYTSDFIPSEHNGWEGGNYPGYKNPEMDRVCKAANREIDETMRKRLIQESERIFSRDLPALPLYFRVDVGAAKAGLVNFAPVGLGAAYEMWNVHTWYWR